MSLGTLRNLLERVLATQAAQGALLGRIVQTLEAPRRRRADDPDRDGRLLAAIARSFGASVFSVDDLIATPDAELRAVLGGVDGRVLGARLKRLRQRPSGPYALRRCGRDDRGALWALTAVSGDASAVSHTGVRRPRGSGAE